MSVIDFFKLCNLSITFDDPFDVDDFQNMFNHFRKEYEPTMETIKECLIDSYQ